MGIFQFPLIVGRKATASMDLDDPKTRTLVWGREGWCGGGVIGVQDVV